LPALESAINPAASVAYAVRGPFAGETAHYDRQVPQAPLAHRQRSPAGDPLRGLALACHPAPALAVTALATLLARAAGAGLGGSLLVGLAFLAGQLSIGWSNDWIDADRDRMTARPDKPVATGAVPRSTVRLAALAALALAVPLSFALGAAAGAVHLAAVASAWCYNLRLKSTAWSWLPYAFSFGLLPVVVTLSLPTPRLAATWAVAAGALLGVGAHLTNVLPDLEDDAASGVLGMPHRLGRTRATLASSAVLVLATILAVVGPPGAISTWGWAALLAAGALILVGQVSALTRPASRLPFAATVALALVDVATLVVSGASLAA